MSQSLISVFGDPLDRVSNAISALQNGQGILLVDDEDRENEGDLIFSTDHLTEQQMAMLIRECSGIVCLCLTDEKIKSLELPQMVSDNNSQYGTAFTISIEAADGVTTGVSASDRLTTIQAATASNSKPTDICSPGHVFPLRASPGGVQERRGYSRIHGIQSIQRTHRCRHPRTAQQHQNGQLRYHLWRIRLRTEQPDRSFAHGSQRPDRNLL